MKALQIHSCSHDAAYSSESSTTEIWFFPELNIVGKVTRYAGWDKPGPVHLCFYGGTEEARIQIRKHFDDAGKKFVER